MPECTINLPEDLDRKIQHYMIDNNIKRKSDAIIDIIKKSKI